MFHTLAYGNAAAAGITDVQLNAIADQVFTIASNRFQVPNPLKLWAAFAGAASMIRARINTASLRLRGFPQIKPFNRLLLPGNLPPVADFRDWPLDLRREEDIEVDTSNNLGAATENTYAILFVSDRDVDRNINRRDIRPIRFTAAVTNAAFAWSAPAALAFQDTIEGGQYAVYGLEVFQATNIAARLVLQNQLWRPGTIGSQAFGTRTHEMFVGGLGLWGYFNTYSVPQIEVLGDTAGAGTVEGHLWVAKA